MYVSLYGCTFTPNSIALKHNTSINTKYMVRSITNAWKSELALTLHAHIDFMDVEVFTA